MFNFQKSTRNPYVDIFVAIITVPTLILLALLLDANIQDSLDSSTETRSSFIVLIFGFGFLVLSFLVCGCIVHKMGMCRWNRHRYEEEVIAARHSCNDFGDCIHVIDLPPSYETVTQDNTKDEPPRFSSILKPSPPPTYELACNSNRNENLVGSVQHI